jgi:hypothetical protein
LPAAVGVPSYPVKFALTGYLCYPAISNLTG